MTLHYGDLRARATVWWALQRARIRLELTAGAAKKAGWGTADDPLSIGLKAMRAQERVARARTVEAFAVVYPAVDAFVQETAGVGDAIALFLGLIPPLYRLEEFPGFPCPTALWTYCGMVAKKRDKFDRRARSIAIAYLGTPAILASVAYRALYRARRETTAAREWSKMHGHRDGIRYVAKRILLEIWQRRLSVDSPNAVLSPESPVTAAGVAPTHPESEAHPSEELSPSTALSTPESAVPPTQDVSPVPSLAAPESDLLPKDGLLTHLLLSAPEPVVPPELLLRPIHHVTAPGLA